MFYLTFIIHLPRKIHTIPAYTLFVSISSLYNKMKWTDLFGLPIIIFFACSTGMCLMGVVKWDEIKHGKKLFLWLSVIFLFIFLIGFPLSQLTILSVSASRWLYASWNTSLCIFVNCVTCDWCSWMWKRLINLLSK